MSRMRASARRRQLLEVAAELFARKGYRGTTTAELAREAGITEPILYRHFTNKLDLFATLVDEVGREVIESWGKALSDESDPGRRLSILLAGNPATHERGRNVYRVIFHAMTETCEDPEIVKPLRRHLRQLHDFVADEVESLQNQNVINTGESANLLGWLLVQVAIGAGMLTPLQIPGYQQSAGSARLQDALTKMLNSNDGSRS